MINTFNIGHIPPHRLAFNNYRAGIHLAGGEIGTESAVRDFIEWRVEHNLFGCVVAPWAGVLLDTGVVQESFSMLPYSGNMFFNPSQGTAASRPTQSGETWVFDGTDDFLSVDIQDHPMNFTLLGKFDQENIDDQWRTITAMRNSTSTSGAGNKFTFASNSNGVWGFFGFTGAGSGGLNNLGTGDIDNHISVYDGSVGTSYVDAAEIDSGNITVNPSGTTVFSIGGFDGNFIMNGSITGATGIFTSALTPAQVTELNSLL